MTEMRRRLLITLVVSSLFVLTIGCSNTGTQSKVPAATKIVPLGDGFRLMRDGQPYFITGARVGEYMEAVKEAGGNSLRGGPESLDRAEELGLTVLVGLRIGKWRHGFDYSDPVQLREQRERIRETVLRHKDHPALLMWAVGNEPGINGTREQTILAFREINRLVTLVKELDSNHPVITVIGGGVMRRHLQDVEEFVPAIDAIGLNAYHDMFELPEELRLKGWKRPYVVTEFGPRGHWEAQRTPWDVPLENTSTGKEAHYFGAYEHAVKNQPLCLGSYVFYWGSLHEKTHTWYGMFLFDGSRLGAVDAMTYAWSGKWPANRAPRVGTDRIQVGVDEKKRSSTPPIVAPGVSLACRIDATDPDGDPLEVEWDLRLDVADNPNVGGDEEPPTPAIEGAVLSAEGNEALVAIPPEPGNYRLFVYVRDGRGSAATANIPVRAE